MATCSCLLWRAPLEGVRKNPPPPLSSAVFACLRKPHHLAWLKSGLGPITTCLGPFWWLIFTFVRNRPFSRIFHTHPLLLQGGFQHRFCTLSAPFVHPLCTPLSALEPPFCSFCTPFVL